MIQNAEKNAYDQVLRKIALGQLYRRSNRWNDSLETWRLTLLKVGQDTWIERELIDLIASYYRRNSDLTRWKVKLDSLIQTEPKRMALKVEQAVLLADLREDGPAIEAWEKILALTPGEGGIDLSGGEKQRLAIARTILNDPAVLILDEATSAVDSQTEKSIQEAIANLVKGRTTIAIAHRLATLRNANRLIVVENGQMVEEGTHEELMANEDGHFATLVRLQAENNQLRSEQRGCSLN